MEIDFKNRGLCQKNGVLEDVSDYFCVSLIRSSPGGEALPQSLQAAVMCREAGVAQDVYRAAVDKERKFVFKALRAAHISETWHK